MTPEPATRFVESEYAREQVHFKAQQLARRRDFRDVTPADLEQELWLGICRAADRFDPAKASANTFLSQVIETVAARLVRTHRRRKRTVLRDACPGSNSVTRPDRIATSDRLRHRRVEPTDPLELVDRRDAVAVALYRVPADVRAVALALKTHNRAETARLLGLTVSGVRSAIGTIRKELARVKLERKSKIAHPFARRRHT